MIRCTSVFERNMMVDYPKSLPGFRSGFLMRMPAPPGYLSCAGRTDSNAPPAGARNAVH